MTDRGQAARRTFWAIAAGLFLAFHVLYAEYWLRAKLGGFYYYRGDDVSRIASCLALAASKSWLPRTHNLPLPLLLLTALFRLKPDPYGVPLQLGLAAQTASLGLVAAISWLLFPDEPLAPLAGLAVAAQAPLFEPLGLSAGTEPLLWPFLLAGAALWLAYLRTERRAWLYASAASLAAASLVRYEGWLYAGALVAVCAATLRRRNVPAGRLIAYGAAALIPVFAFIAFWEIRMAVVPGASGQAFSGLPLSYYGIRTYFRGPNPGVVLSFLLPLQSWLTPRPLLCLLEGAGLLLALFRSQAARGYAAWAAGGLALLCLEAGVFGFPGESTRVLIATHLILAPLCGGFAAWAARRAGAEALAGLAALGLLASLSKTMPTLRDSHAWLAQGQRNTFELASAIHAQEQESGARPRLLYELREGPGQIIWDYAPLRLAVFDRLVFDRRFEHTPDQERVVFRGNPSVFALPRTRLKRYLADDGIGWIVVHSTGALAALGGLARPFGKAGDSTLLVYGPRR